MSENLIYYISKLSALIVAQQFESNKNLGRYDERAFDSCVKNLRKKGFNVLLRKNDGTPLKDPCVTDYGGNWSPVTLITDYGRELRNQGAGKANDKLVNCISILMEKDYNCVNDLLKLLLLLKRPLDKEPLQHFQSDMSFSGSDFFLNRMDSLSYITDTTLSNEALPEGNLFKKSLCYEESWTKHFDSKFQLLGEFSKKNFLSTEKVNSLQVSKFPLSRSSQSRTKSFVFTDFFQEKKEKSGKNLFDIYSCISMDETPLLDTFVDNPIKHKLPTPSVSSKLSLKFSCEWSNSNSSSKLPSDETKESNVIELKRDSNCSHSFSILYKKSVDSEHSYFDSNSLCCLKNRKREDGSSEMPFVSSKEVVLGLWEQEVSLLKEFRPELATDFPQLRMISLREFVENLKYLFTGIDSGTFQLDRVRNEFHMVYGTCLNDVTPESLLHFSKEFIEIGNCYAKLNFCLSKVGKNNFDNSTTISQAFWKCIFEYLELHYSLVLDIPPTINLLSLKSCMRDVHDMIVTMSKICMADQPEKELPEGGELLTYLFRIAEQTCRECVTNIIFGILRNCCNVYFVYILQNWMFKGEFYSSHNEFFVDCRRQKVKMKSRAYYNSFFVVEEKIPSFLRGFEDSIYNCGKSIHFLKLFNPEDKFCQILNKVDYPIMRLCFSEEQLEKLEKDFQDYEKRVLESCGEKITVKTIREEEKEKEKAYLESIREFKRVEEKKREEALQKKLEAKKAKKEKQNQELNEQKNLIEEEKKKKKEKELAEELKLKEEIEKANLTRENLINQEKNLLKNHYNNIMGDLDRRIMVAEARKEQLKESLNETVNDNQVQTDSEGNLTNVDINRNEEPNEESTWTTKKENPPTDVCEEYDENLNPSLNTENKSLQDVPKNISHRTPAAEEAEKNKCKILKSEFALPVRCQTHAKPPEKKPKKGMSALERNKRRVLEAEYNILLKSDKSAMSLKSIPSKFELTKEKSSEWKLAKSSSDNFQNVTFNSVELKPKPKCSNLSRPQEKPSGLETEKCESTDSFTTPHTETSTENVPNEHGTEEIVPSKNSLFLNEKYQNSLVRDMDIILSRISQKDFFCHLREEELDNLPCTNFLLFQRFLKKSIMIPLKVQERLANDALLKHLLKGEDLLSHLNSLRGYFFLNDGEFGRSFTHHTFRSLAKCTESSQFFEKSNLNNIVNEALNYTIHNLEPNAQNLSFRIVKMPPFLNHSSHDVLSPFELTYKVDWPLNIILTEKALNKYKMVFRFLLKLKRINWTLNENFSYLNWQFKRLNGKVLIGSSHFHKIQIFRHAMTQVVITIDDYIFSNGVQLPWINFIKDLETTKNIDDLYQKHVRYIKDVLTRCFLCKNSEDLLDYIHNLIELALKFHYTAKSSGMELTRGTYVHPKYSVLKTTFNEFCFVLKTFLKTLKEKISMNQVLRSHYVLIEKFDLKLT